ncbi:MAG: 50S ribosomal protein L13, partial [Collinsella sp.]|nr:50S ribosomal protein L13 [Collinsella sp.]
MISKSTHYAKQGEVQRNWVLVDADGAVLGRLA